MKAKIIYISLFLVSNSTFSQTTQLSTKGTDIINTTEQVAFATNYFNTVEQLKTKATNFLIYIDRLGERYRNSFNLYNRYYQGLEFIQDFNILYDQLNNALSRTFEGIDQILIEKGDSLDLLNAPLNTKIKFVDQLKKQAIYNINRLIETGKNQIKIIKARNS